MPCCTALMAATAALAALSVRAQQAYTSVPCGSLADCDALWALEAAFDCANGRCACHPQAVFNQSTAECDCRAGLARRGRECVAQEPLRTHTSSCNSTDNCGTGQRCNNLGVCVCDEFHVEISGSCRRVATRLGETCVWKDQCKKLGLGGYSICDNGICVCNNNSVPVPASNVCAVKASLEAKCDFIEQCIAPNSECQVDICACKKGYVAHQNSCIAVVDEHKSPCVISQQCESGNLGHGSVCSDNRICICLSEFFYNANVRGGICQRKSGLDETCDDGINGCYLDDNGDFQNVECKKNKCVCKKGSTPSEDRRKCVSGASRAYFSILSVFLIFFVYVIKQ